MRRVFCLFLFFFIYIVSYGQAKRILYNDTISNTGGANYISHDVVYGVIPVPQDDLVFYGTIVPRSTDSALYNVKTGTYDTNTKLLGTATNGYVSAKSDYRIVFYGDTVPITCLFSNSNYADSVFWKMLEHTINTDGTEVLPYRLTEIAYYSTPKTGADSATLWSYFNVPEIAKTGVIWVALSGGDQVLPMAAETAASTGDTVYLKSGIYYEPTYFYPRKEVTWICVGKVRLRSASGVYTILTSQEANIKLKGFFIDGQGEDNNGILAASNASNKIIENCFFEGCDMNVNIGSTSDDPLMTFRNCVFNSSSNMGVYNVFSNVTNFLMEECYMDFTEGIFSHASGENDITLNYNKFVSTGVTSYRIDISSADSVVLFNNEFDTENTSGYNLIIGAETTGVNDDTINYILVEKNLFLGSGGTTTTHGILIGFQNSPIIKHNWFEGYGIAVVLKGSGLDNTDGVTMYNVFKNNINDIYLKGSNNNKIYNNTFYSNQDATNNIRLSLNTGSDESTGNILSNNIIYNSGNGKIFYIVDNADEYGISGNDNIFYKSDEFYINFETVVTGFSTIDGIMTGSYNTDPNLHTSLYPISPTDADGNGTDLGTDYEDILLNTSVWPDGVVTGAQPTLWDIGAFKIGVDEINPPELSLGSDQYACADEDTLSIDGSSTGEDSIKITTNGSGTIYGGQPEGVKTY